MHKGPRGMANESEKALDAIQSCVQKLNQLNTWLAGVVVVSATAFAAKADVFELGFLKLKADVVGVALLGSMVLINIYRIRVFLIIRYLGTKLSNEDRANARMRAESHPGLMSEFAVTPGPAGLGIDLFFEVLQAAIWAATFGMGILTCRRAGGAYEVVAWVLFLALCAAGLLSTVSGVAHECPVSVERPRWYRHVYEVAVILTMMAAVICGLLL